VSCAPWGTTASRTMQASSCPCSTMSQMPSLNPYSPPCAGGGRGERGHDLIAGRAGPSRRVRERGVIGLARRMLLVMS
jgi:hypothetical protein